MSFLPQESFEEADALVIAEGMESQCGEEVRRRIEAFRQRKPVIAFAYGLDEGSLLYLEERIGKIRDERQQWPGALRL